MTAFIGRREFITLLGGATVKARGQQQTVPVRLKEVGYVEGQKYRIPLDRRAI